MRLIYRGDILSCVGSEGRKLVFIHGKKEEQSSQSLSHNTLIKKEKKETTFKNVLSKRVHAYCVSVNLLMFSFFLKKLLSMHSNNLF